MNLSHRGTAQALRFLGLLLLALCAGASAHGQSVPEPIRESLLNRMEVLYWQRRGDPNVLLKLRVHSGAAFDLAGKGGTMALLGDVLFPDPTTREYVTQELGGRLEVVTGYDSIDVTISGNGTQFERMVEFLRTALVTTQLTAENINNARDGRIKRMTATAASPGEIADRAIANRLFGRYPYGHSVSGSPETLGKIDRTDLILARDRFLNADNATLVVIGDIEKSRVMRALRQLLGQWRKGDSVVPPTFRPPDNPDARVLVINQAGAADAEIRLAVRGLARSDRDHATALLLARIMKAKIALAVSSASSVAVNNDAHLLPGMFFISATAPATTASLVIAGIRDSMNSMANAPPSIVELETARADAIANISRQEFQMDLIADAWLDMETYKLTRLTEQTNAFRAVTAADVQRVAGRLFKGASIASVVVGNSEQLKENLGSNVELPPPTKPVPVSVTPAGKP